jgi:hypothetical protein
MTKIRTFNQFVEEIGGFGDEAFEDRDEWYVLIGGPCADYSMSTPETPQEVEEDEFEQDVEGFYQIGHVGFAEDAFVDEPNFIQEVTRGDDIHAGMMGMIFVHESKLSEEVLQDFRGAPADD